MRSVSRFASGWKLYALVAGFYVLLAMLWTLPVWLHSDRLIGLPGDPISFAWGVAWVPYAISHGLNPYYTAYLNAPWGANYMWPAPVVIYDLLVWPLTTLAGPILSYNSIIVLGFATTGTATFGLFLRFTSHRWMALLASAMFTFGPYMISEAWGGHPDLLNVAGIPLMALVLYEMLLRQKWPARLVGLALALVVLLQALTSEEVLASSLSLALLGALLLWWLHRGLNGRSIAYIRSALMWAVPAIPLLASYFIYQMLAPGALHGQNAEPGRFSAPILSFFLPGGTQLFTTSAWTQTIVVLWQGKEELSSYLGIPLIAVLAWTAIRRQSRQSVWVLLMAIISLVLVMGPSYVVGGGLSIPLPEAIVDHVPLFRDLLPMRLSVYLDLFTMLVLLVWLDQLSWRRWRLVKIAGIGVVLLAWLPVMPSTFITVSTPPAFTSSQLDQLVSRGSIVLLLPYVAGGIDDQAMLWQAESGFEFRMPEGYWVRLSVGESGNRYGPAIDWFNKSLYEIPLDGINPSLSVKHRLRALAYFHSRHVQEVILGPSRYHARLGRYMDQLLGKPQVIPGGIVLWRVPSN